MKCILKYNLSLISYIHHLYLQAFEYYNMPTIACSMILTWDSFVCSLKELKYHHYLICQLCPFPALSLEVPSRVYHIHLKRFLFVVGTFNSFCQGIFFI